MPEIRIEAQLMTALREIGGSLEAIRKLLAVQSAVILQLVEDHEARIRIAKQFPDTAKMATAIDMEINKLRGGN